MWLRHLLAIAVLPVTVTILIPLWLTRRNQSALLAAASFPRLVPQLVGVVLIVTGFFFFLASLREFALKGRGTLAPWDAPPHLVIHGPYRYVRNPMISGVVLILFGEALVLWSAAQFLWAVLFLGINAVYIPLFEEPQLRQRFGQDYIDYCRQVPRILPRLRPWQPEYRPK
jgi:protein-S-isoprenylcysteine O-methyltransferase Ste14